MQHPFEKLFAAAIRESTENENKLTEVFQSLIEKGYRREEVADSLRHYCRGILGDREEQIAKETLEIVAEWVPLDAS